MNKIVVTTSITGGYDPLFDPIVVPPGVDFVCFTDTPDVYSKRKVWQIRKITEPDRDPVRTARKYKILLHRYLPEYEYSIRIDGNYIWKGADATLGLKMYLQDVNAAFYKHPQRHCVYSEGNYCMRARKDDAVIIQKHLAQYHKEGYPKAAGLLATGMIWRKHNEPDMVSFQNEWWRHVRLGSRRDQISLKRVLDKLSVKHFVIVDRSVRNNEFVNFSNIHRLRKEVTQ